MSLSIETERLVLRPMGIDYLDEYLPLRSDPEIARHLRPRDRPALLERAKADQTNWDRHGFGPFAVIDRCNGAFLGRINVQHRADAHGEIEIGWMLRRDSWGLGFATEAVGAVIAWCFAALDISHVTAWIKPGNESSHRVAARVGMTLLRTDTSDLAGNEVFAISREDWSAGADL